jgi:hypothetical protein
MLLEDIALELMRAPTHRRYAIRRSTVEGTSQTTINIHNGDKMRLKAPFHNKPKNTSPMNAIEYKTGSR